MRPSINRRKARLIYAGAGALMLAIPATAVALAAGPPSLPSAAAGAAPPQALRVAVRQRHITYGHNVTVTGTASGADAGATLQLEFAPSGSSSWHALSSSAVLRSGGFRLLAPLRQSGLVRVAGGSSNADVRTAVSALTPTTSSGGAFAPSSSQQVAVAAALRVPARPLDALSGQVLNLRGQLLPAAAGRPVSLQGRDRGSWRTLTVAQTGRRGEFDLRYVAGGLGQQQLRVRFAGDLRNDKVIEPAGRVTVYTQSIASWYEDAGSTGCGFHVFYGVANKMLPCGTKVTFRYGGRTVNAVVDDRGPYVGGREWDFNQNLAAALGFAGVDTVWATQ